MSVGSAILTLRSRAKKRKDRDMFRALNSLAFITPKPTSSDSNSIKAPRLCVPNKLLEAWSTDVLLFIVNNLDSTIKLYESKALKLLLDHLQNNSDLVELYKSAWKSIFETDEELQQSSEIMMKVFNDITSIVVHARVDDNFRDMSNQKERGSQNKRGVLPITDGPIREMQRNNQDPTMNK